MDDARATGNLPLICRPNVVKLPQPAIPPCPTTFPCLASVLWEESNFLSVCGKNAWLGLCLGGADPLRKDQFNVSLGLMYDPKRKLVWATDLLSRPHVLRLDLRTEDAVMMSVTAKTK